MFERITKSPTETAELAAWLGEKIKAGTVLCLEGDLGAGKTLFVQSLAHSLGVQGEVTSPTFNLMNVYQGRMEIYHFDLYRLETEEELDEIGFYEYTDEPMGLVVIEWPDKFPDALPEDYILIQLARTGQQENERCIRFSLRGETGKDLFKELEELCRF